MEYLVELYAPDSPDERATLANLARAGTDLRTRYLGSLYLPSDETCFHRYESPDVETLRRSLELAGVSYERVSEVVVVT